MVMPQNQTRPDKSTTSARRPHRFGPSRVPGLAQAGLGSPLLGLPLIGLTLLAVACGPHAASENARSSGEAQAAQVEPAPTSNATSDVAAEKAQPTPKAGDATAAPSAASKTEDADAAHDGKTLPNSKAGHDLVYRVSPEAIVILALGAEFRPEVTSKRVQGGHQVTVKVEVKATKPIQLLAAKSGPLALSARVRHPQEEFQHDERGESKLVQLAAGETQIFERKFPSLPGKPLVRGDEAELRFGLWGLGTNEEDRLPVKKFFVVKVSVDKERAHVKLDAPEGTPDEM